MSRMDRAAKPQTETAAKGVPCRLVALRLPCAGWEFALHASALVMFGFSVLLTGYRVYFHNQSLQIPLVYLLNDPSLYPGDPFAATLPRYASMLWRAVAWAARAVPLEPLLLAGFLGERLLLVYSAGHLARTFAPGSQLAAVSAMAVFALAPRPLLGGGTLVMNYFEQTGLAIPFLLLALASFHRARPLLWAIVTGIVLNINSLYGAYALSYFGAALLADADYRREWRKWGAALALAVLLASPALLLSAPAMGDGAVDNGLWLAAARTRLPHHLCPSTWSQANFVSFGVLVLLTLALAGRPRGASPRLRRHALVWAGVGVGWVACAFAADAGGWPAVMLLQPARATDIWCAFAAVAMVSMAAAWLESTKVRRPLAGAALAAGVLFWQMRLIPPQVYFIGVLALVWQPVWRRVLGQGSPARLSLALVGLVVTCGVGGAWHRAEQGIPLVGRPSRSMEEVAKWAETHTSPDAVFLINPNWGEFRALSMRPVYVAWKDGSALLWHRPYASDWAERMRALGYEVRREGPPGRGVVAELDRLYASLSDDSVKRLRQRFPLRYWVVTADHESRFPVAYEQGRLKVLDIDGFRN